MKLHILILSIAASISLFHMVNAKPLIVLDPAGSAGNTGRKLAHGYEQSEVLEFTQKLASKLKDAYNVDIEITRSVGHERGQYQTAEFANKTNADLIIHLSFYKETTNQPKIFLYHLVFNPLLDRTSYTNNELAPIPLHQAHFRNKYQTKVIANTIKATLNQFDNKKIFDVEGPFGIPNKPLVGICPPAITIEIGVGEETKPDVLIAPLVESLKFIAR